MKYYYLLKFTSITILGIAIVTADPFDNWIEVMDKYLVDRISKDPYNIYVDIKSDLDFFNDKIKNMKKDVNYQVVYTENLVKDVGAEIANRTSILASQMSGFPEAIDNMNKDFSTLKNNIVELPRRQPCYSKVSPTMDNVKEMGLNLLSQSSEIMEEGKLMTSNMLQVADEVGAIANGIKGKETEDILIQFQQKVDAKLDYIIRDYTTNVHKALLALEGRLKSINPQNPNALSIANDIKLEVQKQLELVKSKTLMDLQDELLFVVKSLDELQLAAGDISLAYDMMLQKAQYMVDDIDYTYYNSIDQSQFSGYRINRMANLTVTYPDGTKLDSSEYIPAYTLGKNEEIYSIAEAGMDLVIIIVGAENQEDEDGEAKTEPQMYTRKIFKMYIDDSTDWVYMWVYKNGAVVQETKYIYNYDGQEC